MKIILKFMTWYVRWTVILYSYDGIKVVFNSNIFFLIYILCGKRDVYVAQYNKTYIHTNICFKIKTCFKIATWEWHRKKAWWKFILVKNDLNIHLYGKFITHGVIFDMLLCYIQHIASKHITSYSWMNMKLNIILFLFSQCVFFFIFHFHIFFLFHFASTPNRKKTCFLAS